MRCTTCDYLLFNLSEPACPECGTAFDLRQYRFQPGSVGFACPHCGHLHGGMGEQYLPATTDEAVCRGCGHAMQVSRMPVVVLSEHVEDAEAIPLLGVPWNERKQRGLWSAWWQTCKLAFTAPSSLGQRLGANPSWSEAYWFSAMCYALPYSIIGLLFAGFFGIMAMVGPASGQGGIGVAEAVLLAVMMLVMCLVLPLLAPLFTMAITAGVAHLVLMAGGPYRGSFGTTAACVLYAQAPVIFILVSVVPFVGSFVQLGILIWTIIISIYALMHAQGVSGARATLAMLVLPVLMLISCVGLIVAMFAVGAGFANP